MSLTFVSILSFLLSVIQVMSYSFDFMNNSFISRNNEGLPQPDISLYDVIESYFDFLQYNSSFEILTNIGLLNSSCASILYKSKYINHDLISNIIIYSGLSVLDVGKEEECKGVNMTYFFLTYDMEYDEKSFLAKYFKFVEEKSFYKGICLFRECTKFFVQMFDMNKNTQLKETLKNMGITNLKIFSYDFQGNEDNKTEYYLSNYKMKALIILICIFCFYVILRILISMIYSCFYKTLKDSSSVQLYPVSLNDESSENIIFKKNKGKHSKNRFCYKFCSFCSLHKNYRILLKKTSKYYNENGIKQISGLRVITLFFITMSHNSWVISKLPHKDLSVISEFNSFWFGFVKFSILAFESLKVLNGINFGYKYISYIKKNYKHLTFWKVLKFYFKGIPMLISFIIATLCLHYFTMEIGLKINPSAEYEYFIQKTVSNHHCMIKPLYIFYPFYYQYIYKDVDCTYTSFTICFKNIHFALCEFYCFTFIVFLTYILSKIKSSCIDILIYLANYGLIFTTLLSYDESQKEYSDFTISKVYGSSLSFIQPHLFMVVYFIAFNIGIMFYHFKDLSSDNTKVSDEYIPFKFNFYFSKLYSKIPSALQIILWIITIILMILVAFNYSIVSYFLEQNSEIIQENSWIRFSYRYEGYIFGFLFAMFVVFILMGEVNINYFLSNNLFVSFGRVYYSYFLLDNFYLSLFHAMYRIDIYLNIKNVVFMSIPVGIFNWFSSICFVILFELPVKRMITIVNMSSDHMVKQSFTDKEE